MKKSSGATPRKGDPLTPCEHEIMYWIERGKSNWDIGKLRGRDEETSKTHVRNIFIKLDVHKRAAAVAEYRQRRLARYRPAWLKQLARNMEN